MPELEVPPAAPLVFISCVHEDEEVAVALKHYISESLQIPTGVFLSSDKSQIFAGERWSEKITGALTATKVVVLLLNPAQLGGIECVRKGEMASPNVRRMLATVVAAVLLLAAPVLGQRQESLSRAASRVNWTSASALNALFKDKSSVKRFLEEIANEGDTSGPEATPEVYEYRFVDLNGDGSLELVALVSGRRLATFLDVVFQTPNGAPPADRLAMAHDGFVLQTLSGFNVGDLNAVLRDFDRDGTSEIVMPQLLGEYAGTSNPQATIPEVFSWQGGDFAKVSPRYPEFYRDEVLPRLERQLQILEALPETADPSDGRVRRAEREKYAREIAEARKRATQK